MAAYSNLLLLLLLFSPTISDGLPTSKEVEYKLQPEDDETIMMVLPDKDELPEDPRWECVESNYWTCSIVKKSLVSNQNTSDSQQQNRQWHHGYSQIRGFQMFFFNKMSRENGTGWENRLYFSGKVYWTFHPWRRDSQVYSLNVWIGPEAGPYVLYVLELRRPKRLPQGVEHQHSASMFIRLNKRLPPQHRLEFGHSYKAKISVNDIDLVPQLHPNGSSRASFLQTVYTTTLDVPQLYASDDTSACSAAPNASQQWRRKVASKWTAAFDALVFHHFDSTMSVRFFGAPPSYCIEQYKVAVYLQDVLLIGSQIVKQKDLRRNADKVLVGQTDFFQLENGKSYTVRISPEEWSSSGECVCGLDERCGCVRIYSKPFSPPSLPTVQGDSQNNSVPTDLAPSKDSPSLLYLVVAIALFLLTLVLLSLSLLLRLIRHSSRDRKRNILLVFNSKRNTFDGHNQPSASSASSDSTSDSRKPLLKKCQSVVFVSGEQGSESIQLEMLARLLQGLGVRVYYCRWEQHKLEENMQLWVHTVLTMVDKIFLFHEPRGKWLLSEDGRKNLGERDIFDDVFHSLHSFMVYNDPRIIHLKWIASQQPMFFSPENIYLLPRDLSHVFIAIKLHLTAAQVKQYQKDLCKVASKEPFPATIQQEMDEEPREEHCLPLPIQHLQPQDSGNHSLEYSPALQTVKEGSSIKELAPETSCIEVDKRLGKEGTGLVEGDVPSHDSGIVV